MVNALWLVCNLRIVCPQCTAHTDSFHWTFHFLMVWCLSLLFVVWQDLIRGALKIMGSRVAPSGAKGWKPLVVYDKEMRAWSWIGPPPAPVASTSSQVISCCFFDQLSMEYIYWRSIHNWREFKKLEITLVSARSQELLFMTLSGTNILQPDQILTIGCSWWECIGKPCEFDILPDKLGKSYYICCTIRAL